MSTMMKLVEECKGTGELVRRGQALASVGYRICRYQGMTEGSGMPIPGLYRIEGSINFDANQDSREWLGESLGLKLEDGRVLGVTLVDAGGRVLSEGHGPSKCLCC
jgi:hypothetical protein